MLSVTARIILWGAAMSAPALLSLVTRRLEVQAISTMVLISGCISILLDTFLEPPESMFASPVLDLAFGVIVFNAWRKDRAVWKLAVVGFLVGQCIAHVAFALAYDPDLSPLEKWQVVTRYKGAINVLCGLTLVTLMWAGGVDGVVRRVRDWMPGRARSRRHAGAPR